MKARYRSQGGRIEFELEAANAKELFGQIAEVQEVFDAEHQCGLCGSKDIKFTVREAAAKTGKQQSYTYYELRCRGIDPSLQEPCRGRFDFGQSLDTLNLFPKRKDAEGNWMSHGGWYRYTPQGQQRQTSDPPPIPVDDPEIFGQKLAHYSEALTPPGMQPTFDRLAEIYTNGRAVPSNMPSALNLIRDQFVKAAGLHVFDKYWRDYAAAPDYNSTAGAKLLLKKLFDGLNAITNTGRVA